MEVPVSPEYSFKAFCTAMFGKDPFTILKAAGAEIGIALQFHRATTKDSDFRKGSKGREYCESLEALVDMLMNGDIPTRTKPQFLEDVQPLIEHLLERWEIGTLAKDFTALGRTNLESLPTTIDPLVITVSRAEVHAMDMSVSLSVLEQLTKSPEIAKSHLECVDIAFHGYDHTRDELFELPEVRNFVHELNRQFPFWLFFLSKRHLGLQCLLYCILPPFLKEEARSQIVPDKINKLLTKQWFPAMNYMCLFAGFSEKQIEQLTDRAISYITTGRFPTDAEPFA